MRKESLTMLSSVESTFFMDYPKLTREYKILSKLYNFLQENTKLINSSIISFFSKEFL